MILKKIILGLACFVAVGNATFCADAPPRTPDRPIQRLAKAPNIKEYRDLCSLYGCVLFAQSKGQHVEADALRQNLVLRLDEYNGQYHQQVTEDVLAECVRFNNNLGAPYPAAPVGVLESDSMDTDSGSEGDEGSVVSPFDLF